MERKHLIWFVVSAILGVAGCESTGEHALSDWEREAAEKGLLPLERAQPEYPRRAALAGVQGCVTAAYDVRPDGRTDNFQVLDSKPNGVFSRAAVLALREWRYPERDEPIRTAQRITFSLRAKPENEMPECLPGNGVPDRYLQPGEKGPVSPLMLDSGG